MPGQFERDGVHRGVDVAEDQPLGPVAGHGPGEVDSAEDHRKRDTGQHNTAQQGRGHQDPPSTEAVRRPTRELGPDQVDGGAEGGEECGAGQRAGRVGDQ